MIGKLSIQRGEFETKGEEKKKIMIFKVIFKNIIGKTLYDANISG